MTLKKETTGEWYVTFGLEVEDTTLPEKPAVDDVDVEDCVGLDLGIQNYIYTSDGDSVDWLDLSDEYERLRREQRNLSRKEHGSNNWEKQRRGLPRLSAESSGGLKTSSTSSRRGSSRRMTPCSWKT